MSNMTLNVSFLAGTDLTEAVKEAKEKAKKFDVAYIAFNFNDRQFSISAKANIDKVIKEWKENKFSFICD